MGTASKTDLVRDVAERLRLPIGQTKDVIDAFLAEVTAVTSGGAKVRLTGFGTFTVKERAPREGRNPKTGETIQIAASRTLTFKASKGAGD